MRWWLVALLLIPWAPPAAEAETPATCTYLMTEQVQPFSWDATYLRASRYRCAQALADRHVVLQVDLVGIAKRSTAPQGDPVVVQVELLAIHSTYYYGGPRVEEHVVNVYDTGGILGSNQVKTRDETRAAGCSGYTTATRNGFTPVASSTPCMPFLSLLG